MGGIDCDKVEQDSETMYNRWEFYAPLFKDHTNVIYEIINEAPGNCPPENMVKAYDIIRKHAPDTMVIFWSFSNFADMLLPLVRETSRLAGDRLTWENEAVGFHAYECISNYLGADWMRQTIDLYIAEGYPLINTEVPNSGIDAHYAYVDLYKIMEEKGIGWLSFVTSNRITQNPRWRGTFEAAGLTWAPDYGSWPVADSVYPFGTAGAAENIAQTTAETVSDEGCAALLFSGGGHVRYNRLNFGSREAMSFRVSVKSASGGAVTARAGGTDGAILGSCEFPAGDSYVTVRGDIPVSVKGVADVTFVIESDGETLMRDWRFNLPAKISYAWPMKNLIYAANFPYSSNLGAGGGGIVRGLSADGGSGARLQVENITNDSYILFDHVELNYDKLSFNIRARPLAGGTVEIWIGDFINNTDIFGVIEIDGPAGVWADYACEIDMQWLIYFGYPTPREDLKLLFKGEEGKELFEISEFYIGGGEKSEPANKTLDPFVKTGAAVNVTDTSAVIAGNAFADFDEYGITEAGVAYSLAGDFHLALDDPDITSFQPAGEIRSEFSAELTGLELIPNEGFDVLGAHIESIWPYWPYVYRAYVKTADGGVHLGNAYQFVPGSKADPPPPPSPTPPPAVTPSPPPAVTPSPLPPADEPGRPKIMNNTVYTAWGAPIRGAPIDIYDFKDSPDHHFETARRALDALCENGLNAAHIYMPYRSDEYPFAEYCDFIVAEAAKRGLYVIITVTDMQDDNYESDSEYLYGFWDFFAPRYRDQANVIYEICSWIPLQVPEANVVKAYDIIRGHAPDTMVIFYSFGHFADMYIYRVHETARLAGGRLTWENEAVGFHADECGRDFLGADWLHNTIDLYIKEGYPVINTQVPNFDICANYPNADMYKILEERGISWLGAVPQRMIGQTARWQGMFEAAGLTWKPDYGNWPEDGAISPFAVINAVKNAAQANGQAVTDGVGAALRFKGGGYARYSRLNFGSREAPSFAVSIKSASGGSVAVKAGGPDGRVLGACDFPAGGSYMTVCGDIPISVKGVSDITFEIDSQGETFFKDWRFILPSAASYTDPLKITYACNFPYSSGRGLPGDIARAPSTDGGSGAGLQVGSITDGAWLLYDLVLMRDYGIIPFHVRAMPLAGGTVEIWLSDEIGGFYKTGEIAIDGPAGVWADFTAELDMASHYNIYNEGRARDDIKLVFKGEGGKELFEISEFYMGHTKPGLAPASEPTVKTGAAARIAGNSAVIENNSYEYFDENEIIEVGVAYSLDAAFHLYLDEPGAVSWQPAEKIRDGFSAALTGLELISAEGTEMENIYRYHPYTYRAYVKTGTGIYFGNAKRFEPGGAAQPPSIYAAAFDSKGGTPVAAVAAEAGGSVAAPEAPVKIGFIFDGWYLDAEYTLMALFPFTPQSDTTFYAKWNETTPPEPEPEPEPDPKPEPEPEPKPEPDPEPDPEAPDKPGDPNKPGGDGGSRGDRPSGGSAGKIEPGMPAISDAPAPAGSAGGAKKSAAGAPKGGEAKTGGGGETNPPPATAAALSDIAGHWAEKWVLKAVGEGFVTGYPDGTFRPDRPVTRAEFTKLNIEAFGIMPDVADADISFSDVAGHWAESYIKNAAAKGLILGVGENRFEPDRTIAREEAATILSRVITRLADDFIPDGAAKEFKDADEISGYAREAVDALSAMGVAEGDGGGRFAPSASLTRAEAVKLIVAVSDALR